MKNYEKVLSEKAMDLGNLIAAGTILGQIGFKNFYLKFSVVAFVIVVSLYVGAYFLHHLKEKGE